MRSFYLDWEILQTPSAKFEACVRRPTRYLTDLTDPETLRHEILVTKHALQTRVAKRGLPHA